MRDHLRSTLAAACVFLAIAIAGYSLFATFDVGPGQARSRIHAAHEDTARPPASLRLEVGKWRYPTGRWAALKEQDRRAMAHRLDCYYSARRAPMLGLGYDIVVACEPYGIDPRLVVAISESESTCGMACFKPYNYWGGIGAGGFATWQDSIRAHVGFLHSWFGSPQSAYDCPGYCIPDEPWASGTERTRLSI